MFSKIQPQQIQIHDFSSPSGHVNFTAGSDYVFANLSPTLSGDFNIVGNLKINGGDISSSSSSNIFNSTSFVVNGTGNSIAGTGAAVLNGNDNTIGGFYNVLVNGSDCSFGENSRRNTILAGNLCTVGNVTGSTILQDQSTTTVNATKNNAIYISYTGGAYINSPTFFEKDVKVAANSDFYLSSSSSGIFSGDINVLGDILWEGELIPSMDNLNATGQALSTRIISTGQTLDAKINSVSGLLNGVQTGAVLLTGNQTIRGDKTFRDDIFLADSSLISSTGANANFIQLTDKTSSESTGQLLKIVSFDSAAVLINADFSSDGTNFATGGNDSKNVFMVKDASSDFDLADNIFAVDSFGNAKIKGALVVQDLGFYEPSAENDSYGANGLITQVDDFLYTKQNNEWKRFKSTNWVNRSGELWLDGNNTSLSWNHGEIQNIGRVDIFSTGGGGGGFTGNSIAGSVTINGTLTSSWSNGLNTSTGDKTLTLLTGTFPIGSGQYQFPPVGWEEMTMNFTDADGFLRTRTFLVRTT